MSEVAVGTPTTARSVAELMTTWGRGWVVSRGTPEPVRVPGGFRVDVGLPGHRVRYVLHDYDAGSLGRLARSLTRPGTWIKISGDRSTLRASLPAAWRIDIPGHLMTAPLAPGSIAPPGAYTLRVDQDGAVVVATVFDPDGGPAATGRLAPAGAYGIVDQVETAVAHRRRGLGSVVMRALADRGAELGMRTGILVATDDGRALYHRLGWIVRAEVSGAFLPEHR